jgi:hypothetical protein
MAGLSATDMRTQDHFRFLDFPAELRLMVYGYLTPTTRCHRFVRPEEANNGDKSSTDHETVKTSAGGDGLPNSEHATTSTAGDSLSKNAESDAQIPPILIFKTSCPVQILRVSQFVRNEAKPVIEKRLPPSPRAPTTPMRPSLTFFHT